jgi:hypothetical protein
MVEGGVDYAVRLGRSAAQTFQVFKIAAMDLSAGSGKRFGTRVRARKS